MTNFSHFQTQITSIMEIMTKSAIAEMTKLFDDSSSVLYWKISRSLHENEALKKKLQLVQHELMMARGQDEGIAGALESPVNTRSVGVQVPVEEPCGESIFGQRRSFHLRRDEEPAGVEQSADKEEIRPEPVLVKQESLEEDLCYRDPQPTPAIGEQVTLPTPVGDGKKLDTEHTPGGDPEELSELNRCEHSDEEFSGLEFVVKAEQEEEHVAHRLNQTGCEHGAGRLNNLGSEYVMYERDSQLWTSFIQDDSDIQTDEPVCSNPTKQGLSIHTQLQHAPASMEFSGNALSSFGASYVEAFDKVSDKPSVCSEELRSEAIHMQQGQYRERLVHSLVRENQTLLPQQQQRGLSAKHMRGNESPAQPHSGSQYETGSTLGTSALNAGNTGENGQANCGKNPFICIFCGKSFDRSSRLISHHRIHTGEKPFSCVQCGKRFAQKSTLRAHQRSHTGEKPFHCTLCGKRFAWDGNFRAHKRSHRGEKPYRCTLCGKGFTRRRSLVSHQQIHTRTVV